MEILKKIDNKLEQLNIQTFNLAKEIQLQTKQVKKKIDGKDNLNENNETTCIAST
jgi:hypothetical protein